MSMMAKTYEKMDPTKKKKLIADAESFLKKISI
jgi:hypothetical protein